MTDRDVVLRKIRALLQKTIANGCPLAEVLAAHAKAQALIDKHQVSHEELYGTGPGPRSRKPEPEPAEPKQQKQQRRQQQRRQQQAEPERAAEVRAPRPRELGVVFGIIVWLIVVVSFVGGFLLGQLFD